MKLSNVKISSRISTPEITAVCDNQIVCRVLSSEDQRMSVSIQLVAVIIVTASILPEIIQAECYPDYWACERAGFHEAVVCRYKCETRNRRPAMCRLLRAGCYGCLCYKGDKLPPPALPKRILERRPIYLIYHLLEKYLVRR